jgi:mannose-6-phosphate isomerase-like protein (cupin superfamily)
MADNVPEPQVFKYERPTLDRGKYVLRMARTDIIRGNVQVLREGGENNLHAHPNSDGFWLVLSGRVRFYAEGDRLLGDLGPHEGILIPRGFKYWFESASDEPLEILQVSAAAVPLHTEEAIMADRVNYTPPKRSFSGVVGAAPGAGRD